MIRVKRNLCCGSRMEELPDEVLTDILHRLPLFCGQRSKLVCKRWKALISSAYFAQLFAQKRTPFALVLQYSIDHLHFTGRNFGGNFIGSSCPELNNMHNGQGLHLDFIDRMVEHEVKASYDDLLLLEPLCGSYVVCNLVTRKRDLLPFHPWRVHTILSECSSEALFIRNLSDYTVISISFSVSHTKICSFSSDSIGWTEKIVQSCPILRQFCSFKTPGVFCDGFIFWMLYANSNQRSLLIALDPFDLEKRVDLFDPPTEHESTLDEILGISRGRLRLFQAYIYPGPKNICVCVWDLKYYDYQNKHDWFLYSKIYPGDADSGPPPRLVFPRALCCHPHDPDVVFIMYQNHVVSCNLLLRQLHVLCQNPCSDDMILGRNAFPYILKWQPTPLRGYE